MPQSIVSIEFEIPGHSGKHISFSASDSLLDHDVVIFSPDISDYLMGAELFQGKQSISGNKSFQLKEQIARWRSELLNAFNHGKTIFVLMHQPQDVFVDSGKRQYNGTGRNRQTTTLVEPLNSYSALPITFEELVASRGKEIRPASQLGVLAAFWSEFGEHCSYEAYFSTPKITPLLLTKTGSKTVGAILRGDKESKKGTFVFLPPPRYETSEFTYTKGDKTYWNKKGVAWGARFISCVLEIDKALRATTTSTPTPTWAQSDQFRLNSERKTESEIAKVTEKMSSLEVEKEKLQLQLLKDAGLRRLLFETGTQLESAILEALTVLGLKPTQFRDTDSEFDVVFTWKEHRFLGEAEGKDTKAVNVDKISQLERNLNEDYAKDDVSIYPKGILFGNVFRFEEPEKRGPFFTEKCMTSAERLKVALVKTPDLFRVARYIKESGETAFGEKCVQAILDANGSVVVFPAFPESADAKKVGQ